MKKLAIIGASGHGKVVADIARLCGYEIIVFLDDNDSISNCGENKVVGKTEDVYSMDCDAFVAIGNPGIRKRIEDEIEKNGRHVIPVLIHPSAVIADSVKIGRGSVVMAGAVINPDVSIGRGTIINTCSSVDHDCQIGNYVHVAIGAHLAGNVTVEDDTWIGAGATVIQSLKIGTNITVGAGAVVVKDINNPGIYIGTPAIRIRGK